MGLLTLYMYIRSSKIEQELEPYFKLIFYLLWWGQDAAPLNQDRKQVLRDKLVGDNTFVRGGLAYRKSGCLYLENLYL